MGIVAKGGNYKTIKEKLEKYEIDTSHFTGKGWNVGDRYRDFGIRFTLEEILVENSSYTNTNRIRLRLISEGLKKECCEKCNLSEWLLETIPLELHHINGVTKDNRIENLQLLCPNCHSLTENYRGKNIKKAH